MMFSAEHSVDPRTLEAESVFDLRDQQVCAPERGQKGEE